MFSSWKTTALGIAVLLAAIATNAIAILDSDPATNFSYESIAAALAGLGLIASRDNDKTSEDVTK